MQTERKLQVGTLALLLSLAVVAGPVNSQIPAPEDCLDGDPFPLDPTCVEPPTVPPEGTPCVDPEATCPVPPDTEGTPCVDPEATCPVPLVPCVDEGAE